MAVNPWGVTSAASSVSMPSMSGLSGGAGAMQRPTVQQQPQTFSQMQKQGVARPPAPAPQPVGMVPTPQPGYVRPQIDPRTIVKPPVTIPQQSAPRTGVGSEPNYGAGLNLEQLLTQRLTGSPTVSGSGPLDNDIMSKIRDALGNPSAYNSDEAKKTFDRLNAGLSEDFNLQRQGIREEMARRGLGDSTIYGGRLGDVAIQQSRAQSDLAGQVATQQAQQFAGDRAQAIAAAMGYNNSAFGNNLNAFNANQNSYQTALQNLLGYGQQQFNNQATTAQINNDQAQQQINYILAAMGLV